MKITAITKYPYRGKEYKSLKELKNAVHDVIGAEVIDQINKKIDIRHKDLFVVLDILCQPEIRKVLTECLNITVDIEREEIETINILDLKS